MVQCLVCLLIAYFTSCWLEPFLLGLPILVAPLILSITRDHHDSGDIG
jgi:hypothetical protein